MISTFKMKQSLTAFAACAAMAALTMGSAYAGTQMTDKQMTAPVVAPECNWTGFYIGGNAGASWMHYDFAPTDTSVDLFGRTERFVGKGSVGTDEVEFLGGGQIGYLWQFNRWVVGLELDGQRLGDTNREAAETGSTTPSGFGFVRVERRATTDYMASGRLRLGYAFGCILPYVTGGVAFEKTSLDSRVFVNDDGTSVFRGSDDNTTIGYTVGAGLEWQAIRWARLGLEYRFSAFDDSFTTAGGSSQGQGFRSTSSDLDLYNHQVVVKVNIPFAAFFGGR